MITDNILSYLIVLDRDACIWKIENEKQTYIIIRIFFKTIFNKNLACN